MITLTPLANPEGATQQEYNPSQEVLIPVVNSTSEFNPVVDQVIFSIETVTGDLLNSDRIFGFSIRNYENTIDEGQISSVVVFPVEDIKKFGYDEGVFNVYYNFYRTALNSEQYNYFIQTISPSRTEVRISVNNIPNEEVEVLVNEFSSLLEVEGLFKDFYIEINGSYYIANNILLDTTTEEYSILLKLYQPLPPSVTVDDQLQVVFESAETVGFNINLPLAPIIIEEDIEYIKGPNFNFQLSDQINNSTEEQDYNSLISITQLTSSYNELENILNQKGITVNVDYTNFDNFIQFSSATQRLLNFHYKVGQIESFNNSINALSVVTSPGINVSASSAVYQSQITSLIQNFDGYENYLYYTSGTLAYPKSNLTQPYNLQPTGSVEVLGWLGSNNENSPYYGGRLYTSSYYDDENQDNLFNAVPLYLQEDPANSEYELFLNMIGQHFDILYSYINTLTDRYNADNRLDFGISKDLVADALRGSGLKLYQNNFSSDDLYSALLGINASGSLLPPTGSEVITNYITASNEAFPLENVNKETYKRLYHNLPYLLNKKGTVAGLRALINCYGIPDTILRISEFGGKDKNNINDWDYNYDNFNYAYLRTNPSNSDYGIYTNWIVNNAWGSPNDYNSNARVPNTLQFRFKVDDVPPVNGNTSSLWTVQPGNASTYDTTLSLEYGGSGLSSASYSGSIPSSSYQYANLVLRPNSDSIYSGTSASISLPFYNGGWWSVMVTSGSSAGLELYAANNIYNGDDGHTIGFIASSSVIQPTNLIGWNEGVDGSEFGTTSQIDGEFINSISGSFQEIRYYNEILSESVFRDYTMNPLSIEGNGIDSAPNQLIFRAALGSDLINIGSDAVGKVGTSIHPKITGSWAATTSSFTSNSTFEITANAAAIFPTYLPNVETFYVDQPAVGIKNRVSEKIRNGYSILPSGDTLSPYISVQQESSISESYTRDVNYVEVAFSPQNEINDDINASMGYFNIGDYIGDPRLLSQSVTSYPALDKLRDTYFEKYTDSYNWTDYIRLIKYFDNSLFKMIKDFIPAKSSLGSGVIIKQHLLERNRVPLPEVSYSQPSYTGSIESGFITGSTGGGFNNVNTLANSPESVNFQSQSLRNPVSPFVTQSWSSSVDTPFGPQIIIQSSQDEFYDGEFSGSEFTATTGELNDENTAKKPSTLEINYDVIFYSSSVTPISPFTNGRSIPKQGEIYLWYDTGSFLDTGEGSSPGINQSAFTGG